MNRDALIYGAAGAPMVKVGSDAWRQHFDGDYIVSLEWDNSDRGKSEPVMLIWSRTAGAEAGVFGICLSSIGAYADPSGWPNPQGWIRIWKALPVLGRAQLDVEAYRLMDVILRYAPELILMPPSPNDLRLKDARAPMFEITLADEAGKTVREDKI